jgi:hypothetical protein
MSARSVADLTLRDGDVEVRVVARLEEPGVALDIAVAGVAGVMQLDDKMTRTLRSALLSALEASYPETEEPAVEK